VVCLMSCAHEAFRNPRTPGRHRSHHVFVISNSLIC
jgi:hypothetical protein